MRNNEVYGDMTAWIAAHAGDNESDLMRLKRNLRRGHREGQVHGVAHALPRAEKALQVPPLWAIIKR